MKIRQCILEQEDIQECIIQKGVLDQMLFYKLVNNEDGSIFMTMKDAYIEFVVVNVHVYSGPLDCE